VRDGKSTAGLLTARLAKVRLQLRLIGHRETGGVDQQHPVAMPAMRRLGIYRLIERAAGLARCRLNHRKRQSHARLAIT
jgi:hypothetical protein